MPNPVARLVEFKGTRPGRQVYTWCPGCDNLHPFTIEAPPGPDGDRLNSGITWEWDGNLEAPTFSPSLLIRPSVHLCAGQHELRECTDPECDAISHAILYRVDGQLQQLKVHQVPAGAEQVRGHVAPCPLPEPWGPCHSFLRAGRWQFLSDSAHHLAGQTIDMVPLPDSHYRED